MPAFQFPSFFPFFPILLSLCFRSSQVRSSTSGRHGSLLSKDPACLATVHPTHLYHTMPLSSHLTMLPANPCSKQCIWPALYYTFQSVYQGFKPNSVYIPKSTNPYVYQTTCLSLSWSSTSTVPLQIGWPVAELSPMTRLQNMHSKKWKTADVFRERMLAQSRRENSQFLILSLLPSKRRALHCKGRC